MMTWRKREEKGADSNRKRKRKSGYPFVYIHTYIGCLTA